MTVSSEQSFIEYTGDGTTKTFTIPFYFLLGSDISITITDTSGSEVVLVYGVNFSVVGDGSPSGGAATLNTAPASGYVVSISRDPPVTQETAYQENGKFPAKSHEKALDKLTMIIQSIIHRLNVFNSKAVKVPESGNWIAPKIADRNNRLFAWDNDGKPIAVLPQSGSASDVLVQLASTASGKGDALIAVKQQFAGAASRNQHDKNLDIVSVKDFGAIGDGTAHPLSERYATLSAAQAVYSFVTSLSDSIDWAALQAACLSGADGIYIPADTKLSLNKTCNTPAKNFAIIGAGPSSIITGTAHILIETTKSANAPDGSQYNLLIDNVHFTSETNDQCYVYLHTLFDYGGHKPHVIHGCTFTHKGYRQTSVLMTGITGLRFINSTIFSSGFNAKVDDTGYGLRVALEDDMSSSVMNIHVAGSSIISISRPIWIPPRTIPTGGRCEGVKIENNLMGDGIMGIYVDATIAVSIVGNQISDYGTAIHLHGCQGFIISDNGEITGYDASVEIINGQSNYITHNGVITNNSIAAMKDNCRLLNMPNLGSMSDITITGNTFLGWTADTGTTYGVIPNGPAVVNHVVVANNAFRYVKFPIYFGADLAAGNFEDFRIDSNSYNLPSGGIAVVFPERQAQRQRYQVSDTIVQTLTAGVTTITIDVSAYKFGEVPVYAECQMVTFPAMRLIYLHDSSSSTQLIFSVQGSALSAGNYRLCYTVAGMSVYGY